MSTSDPSSMLSRDESLVIRANQKFPTLIPVKQWNLELSKFHVTGVHNIV
jgi:hypothetical protein